MDVDAGGGGGDGSRTRRRFLLAATTFCAGKLGVIEKRREICD